MIEQERRHNNGMGLQKIESFFSDIFGCGGCNFPVAPKKRTSDASAGRSYSNSRPLDSALQQHEFYKSRNNNLANNNQVKARNLCGGGPPEVKKDHLRWNYTSKQVMIACDEEDAENSFLNDTASTQPESFLLDDSCLSLPSTISFHERTIPRGPLLTVQEPPRLLPERKVPMVPTETVVGVWPPVLSSRGKAKTRHVDLHQQQRQYAMHRVELPLPSFTLNDEDEVIPPIPVRPPRIKRLKLDDALVTCHNRTEQFHDYEPTRDANGLPCVPQSVCRSRSLDFLFSSNRHPKRDTQGNHYHRNHHLRSSDRSWVRYDEEERARHQLLEMLSDLNETYTTL